MISPFTSSYVGWGLQLSMHDFWCHGFLCTSSLLFWLLDNASIQAIISFGLNSTRVVLIFVLSGEQSYNRPGELLLPTQWNMNLGHWTWVSQAKATRPELWFVYWVCLLGNPYNKCIKQCQNRIWFVRIFAGAYDICTRESEFKRLSCLVASCSWWSGHWLNGSILSLGPKWTSTDQDGCCADQKHFSIVFLSHS
jgi:hypothetical protein